MNASNRLRDALKLIQESRLYNIVGALLTVLLIGTVGFRLTEGWAWGDAFYATVITTTTIGYGDLSPITPGGRLFAIVYAIVAIGVVGYSISRLAGVVIDRQHARRDYRQKERKMRELAQLEGHVIVCGATVLAQYVIFELLAHKHKVVVVANHEEDLRTILLEVSSLQNSENEAGHFMRLENIGLHQGDERPLAQLAQALGVAYLVANPMQTGSLLSAGVDRAKALLSVLDEDRDNLLVVLTAKEIARRTANEYLLITTRATEDENVSKLKMAGATHVFAANSVAGLRMVMTIADPLVNDYWQLMTSQQSLKLHTVDVTTQGLAGQTIGEITAVFPFIVVALKRENKYEDVPAGNTAVVDGDTLIVLSKNKPDLT